ncbi:DUF4177 domain-containing protein [Defluviimonas sp. SAOS-178_SWC]|uniref:DUF4177 domain-containing protein n=1 Tax=Defluviimonas sp. SAOS-178_SWC TaxID=3121287 RepID=UPI003221D5BE
MQLYDYKVVPAPNRGEKARGLKTPADRFANALELLMNELGRDGWEYLRADTLPSEERAGFTKRTTVYHAVLVFRRALPGEAGEEAPRKLLTADTPSGKAPPIRLEAEGVAPKIGVPEPEKEKAGADSPES